MLDRQELHVQTKEKEGALQCLRMTQRDLAEVQHHLQVDLLKCTHGREPERGQSTAREAEQRVKPDTPEATLRSVDHEHVLTDGQRKKESAKVWERTKQWQKLVSIEVHQWCSTV